MLDKSKYSFLIGFVRQLEAAVARRDRDSDLADVCESLARSLGVLLAGDGDDTGDSHRGDDESVGADDDTEWDEPELGGPLEREDGHPADVGRPRRLLGGGAKPQRQVDDARVQRGAVLKGGKRRGTK